MILCFPGNFSYTKVDFNILQIWKVARTEVTEGNQQLLSAYYMPCQALTNNALD